jgi:alkanesulfonate monooxygenase SsuD/methylene tetrahydromethanopterin reductase-like flavin-dependent oxidoreductase (luciferase family)
MAMQLGFFLPHLPPEIFIQMALRAEASGFDSIWCDDHLMSPFSSDGGDDFGCYEAWTAMAYLGGVTTKIRLSHMVLIPTFRGPAVLAHMAATLSRLSAGRLIVTVGAGWYQPEFEAFDLPWEAHAQRIEREREAVQVIRSLWHESGVDFAGRHYRLRNATVAPKPLQSEIPPIWISGDSKRSMVLASELGDGWMFHGRRPEATARMVAAIKPLLGETASSFNIATANVVAFGADEKAALAKLRSLIPQATWERFQHADIKKEIQGGAYGSPERCLSHLKAQEEAGVTSMTLIFFDPQDVDIFIREVMPELT